VHEVTLFRSTITGAAAACATACAEEPPGTRPEPRPFARRNFSATFSASLPGDPPLQLTTLPGVFAHRRADEGGLALAEVASRMIEPGARVFDMGCGCGLVGLLLARHAPPAALLCADSHARAIHCTGRNAQANGLTDVQTLLTDSPALDVPFDVFVGNPPYYSDYRIAELFIRAAYQTLAPGGTAYIVAKSHRWHEGFMLDLFGNAEVIKRRGYGVVKSVRRPPGGGSNP
jgi:16S rRNA (guanine1207-N2)-methyltransferase